MLSLTGCWIPIGFVRKFTKKCENIQDPSTCNLNETTLGFLDLDGIAQFAQEWDEKQDQSPTRGKIILSITIVPWISCDHYRTWTPS